MCFEVVARLGACLATSLPKERCGNIVPSRDKRTTDNWDVEMETNLSNRRDSTCQGTPQLYQCCLGTKMANDYGIILDCRRVVAVECHGVAERVGLCPRAKRSCLAHYQNGMDTTRESLVVAARQVTSRQGVACGTRMDHGGIDIDGGPQS